MQRFCFCVPLVLHVSIVFSKDLIALKPACDVHFSQLPPSHPNFDVRLVSRISKPYCGTMHNEHVPADLTAYARHCRVACRQPRHCAADAVLLVFFPAHFKRSTAQAFSILTCLILGFVPLNKHNIVPREVLMVVCSR